MEQTEKKYISQELIQQTNFAKIFSFTYGWMSIGLLVTFLTSFYISSDIDRMYSALTAFGNLTPLIYMVVSFGFAIYLMKTINSSASYVMTLSAFIAYCLVLGVSLSSIFYLYTSESVSGAFLTASLTFFAMTLVGYTTKKDLSGMSGALMTGIIGLFIGMIISLFIPSLNILVSMAGALIFAGFIAYDTNKLKRIALQADFVNNPNQTKKIAVYMAFHLYLDFINLLLFLIRIMGKRR